MKQLLFFVLMFIFLKADAQVMPRIKSNNKKFATTPVQTGSANLGKKLPTTTQVAVPNKYMEVADGVYRIKVMQNDLYLGFKNDAYAAQQGTSVVQWQKEAGNHLLFRIKKAGADKCYTIQNLHSGLFLDVYEHNKNDGAKVVQWEPTNTNNQKWFFLPLENGTVAIVSKLSGKRVEMLGGNSTWSGWGQPFIMGSYNRQTFMLQPEKQTYRYQVKVSVKDMEFSVRKRGDYQFYGAVQAIVKNQYGKTYVRHYPDRNYYSHYLFNKDEDAETDISNSGKVEINRNVEMILNYSEFSTSKIIVCLNMLENDADVANPAAPFKGAAQPPYTNATDEKKIDENIFNPSGADDFYELKQVYFGPTAFPFQNNRIEFELAQIGADTRVHAVMQDEDGSNNYLDVRFTITKHVEYINF
jgi:hypothetical protein